MLVSCFVEVLRPWERYTRLGLWMTNECGGRYNSIIYDIIVWLGGLLVERRTSVSPIRGSIPGQVAAV